MNIYLVKEDKNSFYMLGNGLKEVILARKVKWDAENEDKDFNYNDILESCILIGPLDELNIGKL